MKIIMRNRYIPYLAAALLCTALVMPAAAQEITGSIVGVVKDSSGGVIPGATVTVTDIDKKVVARTVISDGAGNFFVTLLSVGNYDVSIESPGFKKYVESNIKLDVNQRFKIDATLTPGAGNETITVEASALQVDLQTPMAANLISGTQMRELSLNNRNFLQLTTLMPGVVSDLDDQVYIGTTNPFGQANIVRLAVNGGRQSSNSITVDGASTTDGGSNITIQTYPSIDAIEEFKVLRALYPAESGRSGAGQVNVVTRSGSRDYHGTAYEFFRNEKLNANDFFSNARAPLGRDIDGKAIRSPFRYNNFGWNVSGPVWAPGLKFNEKKDKTFFFFSQEFRRVINYPTFRPTVPDSKLQSGIFPVPVCIAVSGTTCTQTATQITNINPAAQMYINAIYKGLPEPEAGTFILNSPSRNVFNARQETVKIDHDFIPNRLRAFYRLQNDSIPTIDANALFSSGTGIPGVSTTKTNSPGRTHVARFIYIMNPKTILEGGYAYSYGAILSEIIGKVNAKNSPSIQIPLPFAATTGRIPTLSGHGFSAIGSFGPYDNFSNNHAINLTYSKISGPHILKAGMQWNKYRKHENALAGNNEGIFSSFNSSPRPTGTSAFYQQFANFLLGNVASFTQAKYDFTADLRAINFEMFVQDEWRLRPNLTLFTGIRYSAFRQPWDASQYLTNFDPNSYKLSDAIAVDALGNRVGTAGNPLNGILVNGDPKNPYGNKAANEDNNNFAPRLGIAWDPFKKGLTSIRTGYGIYYDQTLYGTYLQNIGTNPPNQETFTFSNVRLDNPAAGAATYSAAIRSLRGVQLPYVTPYYQHWSFDVQQQVTRNTLVTVGYFGSRGVHLIGIVDLNLLPAGKALSSLCKNSAGATVPCQNPGQIFTSSTQELLLDQIRPYPGFRAINVIQPRFNSNYHSFQTSVQQRLTSGAQINFSYTFGKNLTDNWSDRSHAPQNPYDIRSEYGRAQLDRRHVMTLNYIYQIPFFRNQKGVLRTAFGGWQLSGIVTYNSGLPFTATTSSWDPAGIGFLGPSAAGGRPNQVGDPNTRFPKTVTEWFNKSAFADVPAGINLVGNAGRGTIVGPPTHRWDLTLTKTFHIVERVRVQVRAEAFNIWNHTNFRNISTSIVSSTYGQVTTTRDPRIMQLAMKLYF